MTQILATSLFDVVEPLTGGNITGSAFNATILPGGAAVDTLTSNLTVASPNVEIYGQTDDGVPFFVQANGVGVPGTQFARVVSHSISERKALHFRSPVRTSSSNNSRLLRSFQSAENTPTWPTSSYWHRSRTTTRTNQRLPLLKCGLSVPPD